MAIKFKKLVSPILLLVIICLGDSARGQLDEERDVSVAMVARNATERAMAYLLSERDPVDGTWPPGERAAAAVGLLIRNPRRHDQETKTEEGRLRIQLEAQSIAVDFLTTIRNIQARGSEGDTPLSRIDDTSLLQLSAALRGLCVDQRNFHGYNLIGECVRRMRAAEAESTVVYGGMVLAVCNARRKLTIDQIQKLAQLQRCPDCPFFVEEVSMNLLAASCVASVTRKGSQRHLLAGDTITKDLAKKLVLAVEKEEWEVGFTGTALAVQALVRVDAGLVGRGVINRGIRRLISYQKEDGSFGSSISYTALALPALTGQTAADLGTTLCQPPPIKEDQDLTVYIVIRDEVYSKQSTRIHIKVDKSGAAATRGTTLRSALVKFSRDNKDTFDLKLKRSASGPLISKINNLSHNPASGARWSVYRVAPLGTRIDVTKSWFRTKIERADSTFEIVLGYN